MLHCPLRLFLAHFDHSQRVMKPFGRRDTFGPLISQIVLKCGQMEVSSQLLNTL